MFEICKKNKIKDKKIELSFLTDVDAHEYMDQVLLGNIDSDMDLRQHFPDTREDILDIL